MVLVMGLYTAAVVSANEEEAVDSCFVPEMRDPFVRVYDKAVEGDPAEKTKQNSVIKRKRSRDIRIAGIMFDEREPLVLIGDAIYKEGDKYEGWSIEDIQADHVVFAFEEEKIKVYFKGR